MPSSSHELAQQISQLEARENELKQQLQQATADLADARNEAVNGTISPDKVVTVQTLVDTLRNLIAQLVNLIASKRQELDAAKEAEAQAATDDQLRALNAHADQQRQAFYTLRAETAKYLEALAHDLTDALDSLNATRDNFNDLAKQPHTAHGNDAIVRGAVPVNTSTDGPWLSLAAQLIISVQAQRLEQQQRELRDQDRQRHARTVAAQREYAERMRHEAAERKRQQEAANVA